MTPRAVRTVLVHPPNMQRAGKWKKQQVYRTPTNLAGLASYVAQDGFDTGILDFDVHGGLVEDLAGAIVAAQPDVVAFTCLTPRYPITTDLARRCKQQNPDILTVIGGAHVNAAPETVFMEDGIDVGIVGEGEGAFLDLLRAVRDGGDFTAIPNLVLPEGGGARINPPRPFIADLDSLPFPAWDQVALDAYRDPALFKGPHAGIMTSRGCPHMCIFCSSRRAFGREVRFHSPGYVVEQIKEVVERYGINEFMFYDDTFTLQRQRTVDICEGILRAGLDVRYYIQARVDRLDYELAVLLKKSGCLAVAIGAESGDDEKLRVLKKGITTQDVRHAVDALKRAELPAVASYIIGLPGDTHESIRATIEFAKELNTEQAKFMIATPYPGTELYDMAVEAGKLTPPETVDDFGTFTYYQHVAANLSQVEDEDLKRYQQQAYDDYDRIKRPLC